MCDGWRSVLQKTKGLHNAASRLVNLSRLKIANGSEYNSYTDARNQSYTDVDLPFCLEGTRTVLLQQICEWAKDPNPTGVSIFWLCGKAGTGKSTIARTIGHLLDKRGLGASFFFKRGGGDRGSAGRFFSTIASQFAVKYPDSLRSHIAAALDADPSICDKNLREQFDKLFLQPLSAATVKRASYSAKIIVIDAMDECESNEEIRVIIRLLGQAKMDSLGVRVFMTSRPELPIQLGFRESIGDDSYKDIRLEDVEPRTIDHDIRVYLKYRFQKIKEVDDSINTIDQLPIDWPGSEVIEALVRLADHLFIFASTVCQYISDQDDPREALDFILHRQGNPLLTRLEDMYDSILQRVAQAQAKKQDAQQAIAEVRELVGSIALLAVPLSLESLITLLALPPRKVQSTLTQLQSVLHVPRSDTTPVRLLHLSFRDFLINPRTRDLSRFYINEIETHSRLSEKCLQQLGKVDGLKTNMCNLRQPGTKRAEVPKERILQSIPGHVRYACCYWAHHVIECGAELDDDGVVHQFLEVHFIHWLEALSWLGRLSVAIDYLRRLHRLVNIKTGTVLSTFLDDASRFLLQFRFIIDLAPLQLYHSALHFAPIQSTIRQIFKHDILVSQNFSMLPEPALEWTPEILRLEGHTGGVVAVALSPDSLTIASGSTDGTVRLWSAQTGEEKFTFRGHSKWVKAVTFSADGKLVCSAAVFEITLWHAKTGETIRQIEVTTTRNFHSMAFSLDTKIVLSPSRDRSLRVYDMLTGEEVQTFAEHSTSLWILAFSPDAETVASFSNHGDVCLWSARTGKVIQKFEQYKGNRFKAAVFSPDKTILAVSMGGSPSIRLLDIQTGEHQRVLEGHEEPVRGLTFSPDGSTLASASEDHTVRLWNVETGTEMCIFLGHTHYVESLAFFPGSKILISGSADKTVRIWDIEKGKPLQTSINHDEVVTSLSFSPLGDKVASACVLEDWTIRIWSRHTGKQIHRLEGHSGGVRALAFSPDGKTIASASSDHTLRLWNAETGDEEKALRGHKGAVRRLTYSPDGRLIASCSFDNSIRLWTVDTGQELWTLGKREHWRLNFSPTSDSMILKLEDEGVRVWDTRTGDQSTLKFLGWDYQVEDRDHDMVSRISAAGVVAISPDTVRPMLTGPSTDQLAMWDLQTGKKAKILPVDLKHVYKVVFSADGRTVITTSNCNGSSRIQLWDTSSGEEMLRINTVNFANEVSFSSDAGAIYTDIGTFNISLDPISKQWTAKSALELSSNWLRHNGQDVLWLPHDYRGHYSNSHGNMLVIGQMSGGVSFFEHRVAN
ncbi:WD40 repeat-like protein [Myriangium duriaei CBS 260.36]|uniref:WD40 repeat-like protein n=1 Tax=Myriangium duriaei CBS 260.36 TaxID=1168546 RepID=A0A9P4IW37_9PEZI|nr:WD40 repeat-like protein [Myriangium duriaei CBS 260.36]